MGLYKKVVQPLYLKELNYFYLYLKIEFIFLFYI